MTNSGYSLAFPLFRKLPAAKNNFKNSSNGNLWWQDPCSTIRNLTLDGSGDITTSDDFPSFLRSSIDFDL
jgi:hypothetical protein